jgi:hypothetical protein
VQRLSAPLLAPFDQHEDCEDARLLNALETAGRRLPYVLMDLLGARKSGDN